MNRLLKTKLPASSAAQKVELLEGGKNYFSRLADLIRSASKTIHLQVYILEADETGKAILDALVDAVKRRVEVFLLVDAYGSSALPAGLIQSIIESGIHFRKFSPVFSRRGIQLGRRLHHKVLVIDGEKAVVGGINIADKYAGTAAEEPWLDFAIYLEGTACLELEEICHALFTKRKAQVRKIGLAGKQKKADDEKIKVVIRRSDRLKGLRQITTSYRRAVRSADQSVLIAASYFLPGYTGRRIISAAVKRGVEVCLLLPRHSDVPIVKYATQALYSSLVKTGIRLFEYRPAVVHAKTAVVDQSWITVGSYNLNQLSALGSIELNIDVFDKTMAHELHHRLKFLMQDQSEELSARQVKNLSFSHRLKNALAYRLINWGTALLVYFIKDEEE